VKDSIAIQIDNPVDAVIPAPAYTIRGWCASSDRAAFLDMQFHIGPSRLSWKPEQRPDVTEAHPDKASVGFRIDFDLREHLYAVKGGVVMITVVLKGAPELQLKFSLASGVIGSCLAAAAGV
jgi:hypothetical protein